MALGDSKTAIDVFSAAAAQFGGLGVLGGVLYYTISPRIRRWGKHFALELVIFSGVGSSVYLLVSCIIFKIIIGGPLFIKSLAGQGVSFSQFVDLNVLPLGVASVVACSIGAGIDRSIIHKWGARERKRKREEKARQEFQ